MASGRRLAGVRSGPIVMINISETELSWDGMNAASTPWLGTGG